MSSLAGGQELRGWGRPTASSVGTSGGNPHVVCVVWIDVACEAERGQDAGFVVLERSQEETPQPPQKSRRRLRCQERQGLGQRVDAGRVERGGFSDFAAPASTFV